MEPAAHQAGMNLNAIYRHGLGLWPSWDIRYPSELSQHPRSGERATVAVNIPFLVISGPAKPPRQQHELGHLITKEREFHLQRMTQKRRFASLVERD